MDRKTFRKPDGGTLRRLVSRALRARERAYVPYSGFKVGAAALGADGKIYPGCNIENASYGLTVCAERTAIFKMVSEGCRPFTALAVVAGQEPEESFCCGACRQVMSEFASPRTPVIIAGLSGRQLRLTVGALYPYPFTEFRADE